MSTTAKERHSLVYADVEIEAVVLADGDCEVNFVHDGVCVASFDSHNWEAVTKFVELSFAMTGDAA